MRKFSTFCECYHVTDPFPVSEFLPCAFAADSGLTPQTVKSYLSAIPNTQLSRGLPDPREQSSLPMLKRVQAGISRARLGRGHPSRVTTEHELERTSHPERIVLWAICCAAFFGFCRLGELLLPSPGSFNPRLHLAWDDMAVDNPLAPRMVKLHLKQSKTDQLGRGVDIIVGRTDRDLCPVGAILAYVAARGNRQGPFFLSSSMSPLTKPTFIGIS